MSAAPLKKTDTHTVFCEANGRWYKTEKSMKIALRMSKTVTGKKVNYNRKIRCLVNGRLYTSRARMKASLAFAEVQKNPENIAMLRELAKHHGDPEIVAKRVASNRKHAAAQSRRMSAYLARPDVKEFMREQIELSPGMRGWTSVKANADVLSEKLKTHRNGVQVLKYIDCPREKSTGVTIK